jgi:hypothetical protein
MIRGSCLCGAIRYEIGALEEMHHCHCARCRKAHGAAFSTFARAASAGLTMSGEEQLRRYRSSEQVERAFCGVCGSHLFFRFDGLPDAVWVAVATFDDEPALAPQAHIFVGSKASWHAILDDLPQFAEYPPQE